MSTPEPPHEPEVAPEPTGAEAAGTTSGSVVEGPLASGGSVTDPDTGRMLRSSAVVTVGVGLSRVTGLARTVALAYALGTTVLADGYNLANTAPNVVYDLVIGGVLAATLVPVLVPYVDRGDRRAVGAVTSAVIITLVALTAVAVLAAPWIVRLYTFAMDPAEQAVQESVAVPLLRLFLPQVAFYGVTALFGALLNARRSFGPPALAPVLNNVMVIAVLLAVPRVAGGTPTVAQVLDDTILLLLLGLGTTSGIVAMTLVLVPFLWRRGVPMGWNLSWGHPAVRSIVRLSGWTLGYVATNQAGLVVLLALANASGEGSLSAYSYAWLFFQVPVGLFAIAIMTTYTPELARAASDGDEPAFRSRFATGLRLISVVIVPSTVALAATATALVQVLFERGAFTAASSEQTSAALAAFAVGLPGYVAFLYVLRGFYARKDTRTPFVLNLAETVLMLVLAVPLQAAFGLTGTIAAFSIAYLIGAAVALWVLRTRVGGLGGRSQLLAPLARHVTAGAAMLAVTALGLLAVRSLSVGVGPWAGLVELSVALVPATAAYVGVLLWLGDGDLGWFLDRIRRRRT